MKAVKHGNRYRIHYRCPGYPKLIVESFETLEEANLRIAEVELAKKRGTLLPPAEKTDPDGNTAVTRETMTVAQLMEEYVNLYGLSRWSEGTLSCNQHRINNYILPYIGHLPIKSLTTHQLENFYRRLLSEPAVKLKGREHENRTISPSVIEKVNALIRSALNQAIRWNYLQGNNPANQVMLPKYKREQRPAWDAQEARYALSVCKDPVLFLCMLLALGCSMRIGEILGLTWDCVHIDGELIRSNSAYLVVDKELKRCYKANLEKLRQHGRDDIIFTFPAWKKTESTTSLVLKPPKTNSSVRTIYIPTTVAVELQKTKAHQDAIRAEMGSEWEHYNLVVAQNNGRPYEEHGIAQKLRELIREHHLRPVVFHSLRHSSTSVKLRISGGDIKAVQGDTGHAQANMVTDVYGHIMNDDRRQLARQMDAQFFCAPAESHPEKEKTAAQSSMNESMEKLIRLLETSPEIIEPILKMGEIMSGKDKEQQ